MEGRPAQARGMGVDRTGRSGFPSPGRTRRTPGCSRPPPRGSSRVSASSSRERLGRATFTIVVSRLMASAARHTVSQDGWRVDGSRGLLQADVDGGNFRVRLEVTAVNIEYAGVVTTSPYHHGNLRAALEDAAVDRPCASADRKGWPCVSWRAGSGVSHTAAYRHFADREGLLVDVASRSGPWRGSSRRSTVGWPPSSESGRRSAAPWRRLIEIGAGVRPVRPAEPGPVQWSCFCPIEDRRPVPRCRDAGPTLPPRPGARRARRSRAVVLRRPRRGADVACWVAVHGPSGAARRWRVRGPPLDRPARRCSKSSLVTTQLGPMGSMGPTRIRGLTSVCPEWRVCSRAVIPSASVIAWAVPASSRIRTIVPGRRSTYRRGHHRPKQGRRSEVVDVVDVDAGPHDPAHVVDVTAFAGREHRDAAEP